MTFLYHHLGTFKYIEYRYQSILFLKVLALQSRFLQIKDGPWFINGHFLTMWRWEPNFKPSQAQFTAVAVRVRIEELPLEYYAPLALKKIEKAIGPLLPIDTYTVTAERGQYTRLCVQVNFHQPLVHTLIIANRILYEGLRILWYTCGYLGHTSATCKQTLQLSRPHRLNRMHPALFQKFHPPLH